MGIALWAGEATLVTSLALIACIVILRVDLNRRARRRARVTSTWQPVFAAAALTPDVEVELPALASTEVESFLREWNAMQDALKDASSRGLNALVVRLGLVPRLRAMLRGKHLAARGLAIATLGHLRDAASWAKLAEQLGSGNHVISFLAARALLQIDAERALPGILTHVAERHDWAAGRFVALLHQAGPDIVTGPLCDEILRGPADRTVLFLPFIRVANASDAAATLRKLLETSTDERVVCEALRVVDDPSLLPLVRPHLNNARWYVRLLAVEALGRICEPQDFDAIVALLDDEQWWVRYRAAQALVRLPWVDPAALERIRAGRSDRFAREILDQAIAELRFQ